MRINPRAAKLYMVLLLMVIAILSGAIIRDHSSIGVQYFDRWQLAALEFLAYVTACFLWDRKAGGGMAFARAIGMLVARTGIAAIAALGIARWWAVSPYAAAFAQAAYGSQPVVLGEVGFNLLVFAMPLQALRKPDWMIW
ncbi:MAG: hypothetical protein VB144_10440 [Clostridia bacterium]|nr:hypothetical protein [Clostridia bacterium]